MFVCVRVCVHVCVTCWVKVICWAKNMCVCIYIYLYYISIYLCRHTHTHFFSICILRGNQQNSQKSICSLIYGFCLYTVQPVCTYNWLQELITEISLLEEYNYCPTDRRDQNKNRLNFCCFKTPAFDWLMITYIALFSALLSRLTALACGSTWVTSFL